MSIDIDDVRDRIELWLDNLDKWDGVIKIADTTVLIPRRPWPRPTRR